ncbi:MAG: tRNA-dihydrouridine synthase A [Candidatus Tokpelaia sp. JSC188]|nr:MAG: tRNA-dihydrouridine synthase A [Candidatus Tokpelaia sp. JSC188]
MAKGGSEEKISENYNFFRLKTHQQLGRFSVAPMLGWTDRHCRFFHRQLTERALLYSEMIVDDAVIHGDRTRFLAFSDIEHPVALQLGGSNAKKLAEAARIGADFGYDEINLNIGCPSKRVQYAAFGACLMKEVNTVAYAVNAMKKAVLVPITVKCRIGIDEQNSEETLDKFGEQVLSAGADAIWIHARKAWLKGLSSKENREIPPLDYERVYRFREKYHRSFIGINGGIQSLDEAITHLKHVDGVMIGRTAYHNPLLLMDVDRRIYGQKAKKLNYTTLLDQMAAYIDAYICNGGRVSHVTRNMIGLFHGFKGARRWRQILSTESISCGATSSVLFKAFKEIVLP